MMHQPRSILSDWFSALVPGRSWPIALLLPLFSAVLNGQYTQDALRFSMYNLQGSSRFIGMGGAMGAVGADFTTASYNPAGIGFFQRQALSLSPGLNFSSTESDWLSRQGDSKSLFQFGSAGLVLTRRSNPDSQQGLQFFNFSIGYNRLASFNQRILLSGQQAIHGLGSYFSALSNGTTPGSLDPFSSGLAFQTYLIDSVPGSEGLAYIPLGAEDGTPVQISRQISRSGSHGEVVINSAINYAHRFYLGATLGIHRLDFEQESTVLERDVNDAVPMYQSVEWRDNLFVSGTGFSFKLGAIYRITEAWRVGASIHSPVFLSLDEQFNSRMNTQFNSSTYSSASPILQYAYDLNLPWRWQLSSAYLIKKKAILAVDYEQVNYSGISFAPALDFSQENMFVDTAFGLSHGVKLGFEYRIEGVYARLGYQFQSSPLKSSVQSSFHNHIFSTGLGWQLRKWITIDGVFSLQHREGRQFVFEGYADLPAARVIQQNMLFQISATLFF
jgi:hypothetical protein